MSYQTDPTLNETFNGSETQRSTKLRESPTKKEDEVKEPVKFTRGDVKRKADTVCHNPNFDVMLKDRQNAPPENIGNRNKTILKSMSTGRPPKERLDIPAEMQVYGYGSQKLNIWEQQKEHLRKKIAQDTSNYYSYSKEFLSLAFPLINENEIAMKAKQENEARWKTKSGFDNVMKR